MNLDQEITIVQFAQGVHSALDLPERFGRLNEHEKNKLFLQLNSFVDKVKPTAVDVDQALADSSLNETDIDPHVLNRFRPKSVLKHVLYMPDGDYGPVNRFLLYLFKVAYQRQFRLQQGTSENWWYWDLSEPEVAQAILTSYHERVEEIYTDSGFRSEFISLAKLWYEHRILEKDRFKTPEPASEPQTHFTFVTYDEMIAAMFTPQEDEKYARSIRALANSLGKAFTIRYGIDDEQAGKLVSDVIERHLRETYHTSLWGE